MHNISIAVLKISETYVHCASGKIGIIQEFNAIAEFCSPGVVVQLI